MEQNKDEIIARLLPLHLTDIPASFTIIGHIAHFNLREDFLPYKYLIGQVILEVSAPPPQHPKEITVGTIMSIVNKFFCLEKFGD
jgi:hypothetical protein